MHIDILAVGRIKEKYLLKGTGEYLKRLSRYARVSIKEVPEESAPENLSESERELVKKKEAMRLKRLIHNENFIIALDRHGKMYSSREFAGLIEDLAASGRSKITFLIGGPLGLAEDLLKTADLRLSFSKLTFPHRLIRLVLLEQLYRVFKIIRGEPYHK